MDNSSSLETVVVINCILNAPLMLTSITGNALVLAAIFRSPSLRSVPSTIFLCSLAITDFLVGLVVQPCLHCQWTSPFNWWASYQSRTLYVSFPLWCFPRNNYSLIVDRFLALHYHVTYANLMTTKRAMSALASLWFVSILLPCLVVWKSEVVVRPIAGVVVTICFVISSSSYIKIFFIVRHHEVHIRTQQQAVNSFNISVNIPDSNNMILSKKHALKTFIYFICMVCCYLPYLSYSLLRTTSVIGYEVNWTFAETVVTRNRKQ